MYCMKKRPNQPTVKNGPDYSPHADNGMGEGVKHSRFAQEGETVNGGTSATDKGWDHGNVDKSITQKPKKTE